jgi:hypothetical protein
MQRQMTRVAFIALFIVPVLAVPLVVIGGLAHIHWMKIAGIALVVTVLIRNLVFTAIRMRLKQQGEWHPPPTTRFVDTALGTRIRSLLPVARPDEAYVTTFRRWRRRAR